MALCNFVTEDIHAAGLVAPLSRRLEPPEAARSFLVRLARGPLALFSGERLGQRASNSEIVRWLQNHSVEISGSKPGPDDPIVFPVTSLVFFPSKPESRITAW